MIDKYGLTDEQRARIIENVLDERARLIVVGMLAVLDETPEFSPRVAQFLAVELLNRYGTE